MEQFRRLEEKDKEEWFNVLHAGYQSLKELPISFDAITAPKEKAFTWFEEHPAYGWFVDGRLAASVSLRMPWSLLPGPKKYPHIGWFVTEPSFRKKGYGKKLISALEEEVLKKELKAPAVTLGTAKEHPWLVFYYESLGFEAFDTVQLKGKLHHTVFLIKRLADDHRLLL